MGSKNVLFAQIQKVDEEKRLVYGRATEEVEDQSGEIFDYETSKPFFDKWSKSVEKDSGGKSVGNLRAMHGKVAAGKLTEIIFKDDEKAIDIVTKVVDDAEWKKVTEGVYTGFSIGGSYVKTWDDPADATVKRYTADPVEISLVDRPCVKTATFFDIHKADGTLQKVDFRPAANPAPTDLEKAAALEAEAAAAKAATPVVAPTPPETLDLTVDGDASDVDAFVKALNDNKLSMKDVLKLVTESVAKTKDGDKDTKGDKYGDVKYADAANKKYPIDTEEHIRAAWSYINKQKNADKYTSTEVDKIKANIVAAWKETIDKEGPPSAEADDKGADKGADKSLYALSLAKGMYTCGSLTSLIQSLYYMVSSVEYEESVEQDGSGIGTRLRSVMIELGDVLKDMVSEEVDELTTVDGSVDMGWDVCYQGWNARVEDLRKSLPAPAEPLEKKGARNSKKDQDAIQSMHDNAVALGADCGDDGSEKHQHGGSLAKFLQLNEDLTKAQEQNASLAKAMTEVTDRLAKLEAQPMPTRVILRAVEKGQEVDPTNKAQEVTPIINGGQAPEVNEAATLIKMAHKQGGANVLGR